MAQILKWSLVSLIGLVVCYLIAAMLGALVPGAVAISKQSQSSFGTEIKLVSGPIHYDLLLPLNETTRERFNAFNQSGISISNSDAEWLLVGWGAKDFYTTVGGYSDLSLRAIWRGLTGDASVISVEFSGRLPSLCNPPKIRLSDAQYDQLLVAILASFKRNPDGSLTPVAAAGFNSTDRFFAGEGKFNILATCMTSISIMFRAAALKVFTWTPTPISVTLSH